MEHRSSRPARRAASLATLALAGAGAVAATLAAAPVRLFADGTYASGLFAEGGAEIVKYDPKTRRVFAVNAAEAVVDVLDVSNPASPVRVASIDVADALDADPDFTGVVGGVNSVAVHDGVLAVAVQADPKTDDGRAAFFRTDTLGLIDWVECGALPDMITFAAGGKLVLVANEGEPNSYGEVDSVDPEGSITVIRVRGKFARLIPLTIDFTAFNGQEDDLRAQGIRIFGPGATAAQDLEPEFIAVGPDGRTAYVTLQENNAVAELDLRSFTVSRIFALGFKDHSVEGNGFDGSDRDGPGSGGSSQGLIRIANWPVFGVYMPDGIAAYRGPDGRTYFVTANEGDSRQDWLAEEARASSLTLDPTAFPDGATLKHEDSIGRLTVTTALGDPDEDGDFDALYAFGGRSFSIWDQDGVLVFDSGDQFERITAERFPANFNSDHESNNFDNRSDNKGPEPEGVVLGKYRGRTYAFIGLERIGGVMIYDVTDPATASFVAYHNDRDFSGDPESGTAGDLGPEGLEFIRGGSRSPDGKTRLVVGNEVSGTTTLFRLDLDRTK